MQIWRPCSYVELRQAVPQHQDKDHNTQGQFYPTGHRTAQLNSLHYFVKVSVLCLLFISIALLRNLWPRFFMTLYMTLNLWSLEILKCKWLCWLTQSLIMLSISFLRYCWFWNTVKMLDIFSYKIGCWENQGKISLLKASFSEFMIVLEKWHVKQGVVPTFWLDVWGEW